MDKTYKKPDGKASRKFAFSVEDIKKSIDYAAYYTDALGELPPSKADGWVQNTCCPFHSDTNGSFGVNVITGAAKCFGCDFSGDVFEFHQKKHGCDFQQALTELAAAAGLSEQPPKPKKDPARDKRIFGNPVADYVYRDADAKPVMMVRKFSDPENPSDKVFIQHRPAGKGWLKGVKGHVTPIPYHLRELMDADLVFVPEGEKDVDNLRAIGISATCNPGGAGKWPDDFNQYFTGKNVVILPDNDEPGRNHALLVAGNLHGHAASIRILELPGLPPKGDVTNFIDTTGKPHETLLNLADAAPPWEPPKKNTGTDEAITPAKRAGKSRAKKSNMADELMGLIPIENLFHDEQSIGFIDIFKDQHRETLPLNSKAFRDWLSFQGFQKFGKIPSSSTITDALSGIDGRARFIGPERQVFVRIGQHAGNTYLDLGGPDWNAVEISPDGWRKVSNPEIRFWRPKGLKALPEPTRGGTVESIKELINLDSDGLKKVTGFLLSSMRPGGPYPILTVNGEQGSGKSSAVKIIRRMIDPSVANLRSVPKNEHDLMINAKNSWIIAPDNLSSLTNELADALCRLSSGGGFSTKTLYSNDEETIFSAARPIMLNGITDLLRRADLGDRCLLLDLPAITEEERRSEEEMDALFSELLPGILGALIDGVVSGLKYKGAVVLKRLPRMADAAIWWTACERAGTLPWMEGGILEAFNRGRAGIVQTFLEGDPVAAAVLDLIESDGEFTGTNQGLLDSLNNRRGLDAAGKPQRPPRGWPDSPKGISAKLNRAKSFLREHGIIIEDAGRNAKQRLISISLLTSIKRPSFSSQPSLPLKTNGLSDDGKNMQPSLPSQPSLPEPEVF